MRSLLSGKPKRLQPQRWRRGYFINQVVVNSSLRLRHIPSLRCTAKALTPKDYSQLLNGKSSNRARPSESLDLAPQAGKTAEKVPNAWRTGTLLLPKDHFGLNRLNLSLRRKFQPESWLKLKYKGCPFETRPGKDSVKKVKMRYVAFSTFGSIVSLRFDRLSNLAYALRCPVSARPSPDWLPRQKDWNEDHDNKGHFSVSTNWLIPPRRIGKRPGLFRILRFSALSAGQVLTKIWYTLQHSGLRRT